MTQRTEAEIRAEIKRLRDSGWKHHEDCISALEWTLSASPSPVAGDDEIVEAAIVAMVRVGFERDGRPPLSNAYRPDEDDMESMRAAIAVARPLIERAARASADADNAELRARLAKAEEALEPFVKWARPETEYANEMAEHVSSYGDDMEVNMSNFDGDPAQPLLWGDFRRAAAALSDLRKARGEAP